MLGGEREEAVARHRRTAPALAPAAPREARIDVVAAVLEDGSDVEFARHALGAIRVVRPHRSGETEAGVAHERDRLLVVLHPAHGQDRRETLVLHEGGSVRHVDQQGRREEVPGRAGDPLSAEQEVCALRDRVLDLALEERERRADRERPEGGRLVERISHPVGLEHAARALDEFVVDAAVHVDALDRAARLPGVVAGAVDDVRDGKVEVAVGGDVRGILATEFQAHGREPAGGLLHHPPTGRDRPGERDVGEARIAHQSVGFGRWNDDVGEQVGNLGVAKGARDRLPSLCLSTTVLPASSAGTITFTGTSSG